MSEELIASELAEAGPSRRKLLAGMGVAAGGGLLALAGTQRAEATVGDASYYSYGPYRYLDTRQGSGGRIYGGENRTLSVFAGLSNYTFACNLTVVNTAGSGYLALYNADISRPEPYSSINWQGTNKVVANFTMLDLGSAGAKVYCSGGSSTNTHFIIDVVGYFYNNGAAASPPADLKAWDKKVRRQLERERSR